jgi:hypothetical protein
VFRGAEYNGHNLVFVVGCPRSGTTWVQRLLASHPRVRTGQESDLFDLYVGPQLRAWRRESDVNSSGRGGVGLACYWREEDFLHLLKDYAVQLLEPMVGGLGPGEIFVEKTPSHVLYVPEIVELLPEARFLHVLRDCRDVVASLLAAGKSWGSSWAPRKARGAALTWVAHVEAAREAAGRLPATQYCEVRYEDLHARPVEVLARMAKWLGLVWSEADIVAAVERNRPELAKAGGGTPIPLGGEFARVSGSVVKDPEGFVRKARAGTWREDLSPVQRFSIWSLARRSMARVGYQWSVPW